MSLVSGGVFSEGIEVRREVTLWCDGGASRGSEGGGGGWPQDANEERQPHGSKDEDPKKGSGGRVGYKESASSSSRHRR